MIYLMWNKLLKQKYYTIRILILIDILNRYLLNIGITNIEIYLNIL